MMHGNDGSLGMIVNGLEKVINGGNYIKFLNELDRRGTGGTTGSWELERNVVLEGFRLFRFYVVKDQLSNPDAAVLSGETWVKTIKTKLFAFQNDDDSNTSIIISGLLTFLTLSSLPGSYKKFLVQRGGVECAITMLEDHSRNQEISKLACALLLSLSLNEKDGLNANHRNIITVVKKLISIVQNDDTYGTDFALRVIYYLTFHKHKISDTGTGCFVIKSLRESKTNIVALLNVLKKENPSESTVEATVFLLWRLSVPKDDIDDANISFVSSNDMVETVISTMDSYDSISIRAACFGIIANISMRSEFQVDFAQIVFLSMHNFFLVTNNIDERLATCALHAICNMLEIPRIQKLLRSDQRIMESILFLMKKYPKSEELVEFACLAIGHASRNAPGIKESFMSLGAFDLVRDAFEEFVTTRADNISFDVKDASLCAFATLTGCRSGAEAAINTRLIDIFETLLAVETDRDFAAVLNVIVTNSRICTTINRVSLHGDGNILRSQPHRFSELIGNTTEFSHASLLIQTMQGTGKSLLEVAVGSNVGYMSLISAMARFESSVGVQEHGCALLAEIYFYFTYPMEGITSDTDTFWSIHNQRQAISIIQKAIKFHRGNTNVQYNGCLAILNLVYSISELDGNSLDNETIKSLIGPCQDIILECLQPHGFENNTLKTQLIYADDFRLQIVALDAFIIIQEAYYHNESIWSAVTINTFLCLISSESKEVSLRSSAALLSNIRNNPAPTNYIQQRCRGSIEKLISSLGSKVEDVETQVNIYSILNVVITGADINNSIIGPLKDEDDGIYTLCMSLNTHSANTIIPITVFKILSSLLPRLGAINFSRSLELMKLPMTEVLKYHVENPEVEAAVFDVLIILSQRDDDINIYLLQESRIRMIITAMQFSLGYVELQKKGCNLLSLLSDFRSGKEIIGKFEGIGTIINAMLAHSDSVEVQKKGLITIKNLATASTNKPMITELEGENAVIYSMYIHYRSPEVISAGLSALNNIAVDSISRSVAEMNAQVLVIVVAAMKRFKKDELVQKNACFYLKTCSYLPSNVRMMIKKSDALLPVLLQAADNFPKLCGERATALVNTCTK